MLTFCLIVIAVAAYLLGAVNGSIIASKYFFKKDIRDFGSGNAGLTNFYRIFGTRGILLVLFIDIMKTALAVFLGWILMHLFGYGLVGKLFAGFFVMLGHAFPVYYNFKGGKGVLCGGILVFMMDWRIGLICWAAFLVAVVLTRYVSLGSICAGIALPIGIAAFGGWWLEVVLGSMCALLLVVMHRRNIIRLIAGNERKLSFHGSERDRREREQSRGASSQKASATRTEAPRAEQNRTPEGNGAQPHSTTQRRTRKKHKINLFEDQE